MKLSKEEKDPELSKKYLTLFILFFPSLLLAALPGNNFLMVGIKVLLIFYQFVVVWNFVNSHYGI